LVSRFPAAVALVVFLLGLGLTGVRDVSAHAFLDKSDPAANAVLNSSPQVISLWFTEPLEHTYTRAELYDQMGMKMPDATFQFVSSDPKALTLTVPANLPNGTYSVVYQTLSAADGHEAQGYFAFTIGTESDVRTVVPPAATTTGGPPEWMKTIARWIPLLGLTVCVAVWPIWLLVLRPAISPAWQAGPRLTRRVRRLAALGIAVALLGSVFALLVQADGARDQNSLLDATRSTLTDTRYGRIWLYRVVAFLVFAVVLSLCAWWWPKRRKAVAALTLLAAVVLPIPFSLIAHASAQTAGRTTAIAFDVVHLLGASLWVGGLFVLVGGLLPTLRDLTPAGRRTVLARAIPRFSAIALTAWGVLVLTGLYNAWLQVGNLDGLRDTAYGHSLEIKLLLLAPLLALAASNLLVVSRHVRQDRTEGAESIWSRRFAFAVGTEALLVVAVLLVVGRLTSQPPAREALAQETGQVGRTLDLSGRSATLTIAPAVVGSNHYRLDVAGDALPPQTEALLRLTPPDVQAGQKEIKLERVPGNAFEYHGSELSIVGDWQITAVVREIGEFNYSGATTVPVAATAAGGLPGEPWHFGSGGLAGLVLMVAGIAGLALAWYAGRTPLRKESAGLAVVALALGAVLLLQSRVDATTTVPLTAKDPVPADQASVTRGRDAFQADCAVCHGATGRGDGPAAASVNPSYPPPADFTTAHAKAHYDGEFFNWIKYGKPPTAMPPFGNTLTDAQIWDVINYIRVVFQGAPGATPAAGASPAASPEPTMMPMP
jgi:copper transport protein